MFQRFYKISFAKFVIVSMFAIAVSLCLVSVADAASLYILPSSTQVSEWNIVSVKILVNTEGESINNSEGILLFPTDLLEVMSVSKNSSIFTLWVEEPKFSNITGDITFNGGIPNPGYIGGSGEVLSIVFRGKKSGNASLVFSDSAVRRNDGLGTDILASKITSTIVVSTGIQVEVPPVKTLSNTVPAKPVIISSTHPQQEDWYSIKSATFSWTVPNDVTSIQTLLGKSPNSVPTVSYDSSVSRRTVNNLTDGILYFHLRYQNSIGWSPVAHYKIQMDSTPPDKFSVNVRESGHQRIVNLNASDALSGIDSYSIKIDDLPPVSVKKSAIIDGDYVLPTQNKGEHTLVVTAYDKASNHTEASTIFSSPEITPPSLTIYPDYVTKNTAIKITGTTDYKNENVVVYVQQKEGEILTYPVMTSEDGTFTIETTEFKSLGIVTIWSELVFANDVKSRTSSKITFEVHDTKFIKAAKTISYTLSMLILVIALLLILIFMTYMGWYKFFGLKKRLNSEIQEVVESTHKAFTSFKEELINQLDKLEKIKTDRELNKKEEKIFKDLQKNIDSIDEFIEKKVKKIK